MDIKEYINSGILELYVAGALSEEENREVAETINKYPEIEEEVEAIEASILQLTAATSPKDRKTNFESVKEKITITENKTLIPLEPKKSKNGAKAEDQPKVEDQPKADDQPKAEGKEKGKRKVKSKTKPKSPVDLKKVLTMLPYMGWAAAGLFAIGLFWMVGKNSTLQEKYDREVNAVSVQNMILDERIVDAEEALQKQIEESEAREAKLQQKLEKVIQDNTGKFRGQEIFTAIRNEKITTVTLTGQKASPRSYAKAYWNKEEKKIYLDVQGLPEPPEGKVYQLWTLKLDPLTPTSLGTLDNFDDNIEKIFIIENSNPRITEGFGITLEPAGGSEEPTLDKLYTLGVLST
ncbi:anti-sigma factor domain-containing protein [Ascidiimonas sp. W6]|uniref:anti-sigma factor domain-containing protein n=1 Tax=Ascidiimonas meishanensis TaxID=3128903 RepID=UPI0030EC5771